MIDWEAIDRLLDRTLGELDVHTPVERLALLPPAEPPSLGSLFFEVFGSPLLDVLLAPFF